MNEGITEGELSVALFDCCCKSAWTIIQDCLQDVLLQVIVQERWTLEMKRVEGTLWRPWWIIVEFNNRCGITMTLVEMYSVYSSDQKRFPVVKILFVRAGRGVLLSFFLAGQFRTGVLLPLLRPPATMSQRLCFEWWNAVLIALIYCVIKHHLAFYFFLSL